MALFLLRRALWALLVIWAVSLITFTLSRVVPADPAAFVAGLGATKSQIASVRKEMGLDRPLPAQYVSYVRGLARLDLGKSIRTRRSVAADLRHFLPATLELILISFGVYVFLSLALGVLAALHPSGTVDLIIRFGVISGSAIPVFWLAIILQLLFYTHLGWLPIGGRIGVHETPPPFVTGFFTIDSLVAGDFRLFQSVLVHLILPVTTVVLSLLAVGTRLTRATFLEELSKPYVRVAASKGLSERRVLFGHVLKNALNPIITVTSIQLAYLLAWTILIEAIFSWPGIGLYAYDSFQALDYNPIMALALLVSVAFVVINLITDLVYPLLDPRIAR
ncbi:MAG TPA: ABC transporter permease [Thermomicrobiales bacterium]|jgi:peptide/nickel transport system permease protein